MYSYALDLVTRGIGTWEKISIFICHSCVPLFTLLSLPGLPSPNSLPERIPLSPTVQAGTYGKHLSHSCQLSPLLHSQSTSYISIKAVSIALWLVFYVAV